jgi:transcriptional regulator with XRE-family HTH domain
MATLPESESATVDVWSDISDRLRRARVAKQMTLRALAGRIGVSPSLISQIETGKVKPSVNTLYALAVELDQSVDEVLFGGEIAASPEAAGESDVAVCVQRAGARASVELAPGVLWERLTGASEAGVDFLSLVYAPGSESVPANALHRHGGREWGYVVSGTLQVDVAGLTHVLNAGDSIAYSSGDPHRLSNPGDVEARAIWFILGRRDAETGPPSAHAG